MDEGKIKKAYDYLTNRLDVECGTLVGQFGYDFEDVAEARRRLSAADAKVYSYELAGRQDATLDYIKAFLSPQQKDCPKMALSTVTARPFRVNDLVDSISRQTEFLASTRQVVIQEVRDNLPDALLSETSGA